MSGQITAIETSYDGHLFRSRLEARWAVFFNALGIRYDYEPEGFDLGTDGYYLPDFWLPDLACWVEIKGEVPTAFECGLCEHLATRGRPVIILWGKVGDHGAYAWWTDEDTGDITGGRGEWGLCPYSHGVQPVLCMTCGVSMEGYTGRVIRDACIKARSARFEYDDREPRPYSRYRG